MSIQVSFQAVNQQLANQWPDHLAKDAVAADVTTANLTLQSKSITHFVASEGTLYGITEAATAKLALYEHQADTPLKTGKFFKGGFVAFAGDGAKATKLTSFVNGKLSEEAKVLIPMTGELEDGTYEIVSKLDAPKNPQQRGNSCDRKTAILVAVVALAILSYAGVSYLGAQQARA